MPIYVPQNYVPLNRHNGCVNGPQSIWQRGTSFVAPASGTYLSDRWQWEQANAGAVCTLSRVADSPLLDLTAIKNAYCLSMTIPATPDASIGSGDNYSIFQTIEGLDACALYNGMAVSWWVKAHRTGTYGMTIYNYLASHSYVVPYTINVADTWEYKTAVIPAEAGASIEGLTGRGLAMYFNIASGLTYQATPNTWTVGGLRSVAGAVNGVGATTDVFKLTLVNVVPGTVPLPLLPLPFPLEFIRAQRYYEVINTIVAQAWCGAGSALETTVYYRATKGGTPTVTVNGTWGSINTTATKPLVDSIGPDSCELYVVATASAHTAFNTNTADDTVVIEWNPT